MLAQFSPDGIKARLGGAEHLAEIGARDFVFEFGAFYISIEPTKSEPR